MKKYLLTRETGKWTDFIPVAAVLSFLITVFSSVPASLLHNVLHIRELLTMLAGGNEDAAQFLEQYLSFDGIWILFFLIVLLFKANRPMLKALAYRKNTNNVKGALAGLLLGFGMNGICILLSCLTGDIISDESFRRQFADRKFDLVVANILAEIIIPLSGVVGECLAEGGIFVSSGILASKEAEVSAALKENGFEILEVTHSGDWIAIAAARAGV